MRRGSPLAKGAAMAAVAAVAAAAAAIEGGDEGGDEGEGEGEGTRGIDVPSVVDSSDDDEEGGDEPVTAFDRLSGALNERCVLVYFN